MRSMYPNEQRQIEAAMKLRERQLQRLQELADTLPDDDLHLRDQVRELNAKLDVLSLQLIRLGAEIGYAAGRAGIHKAEVMEIIAQGANPSSKMRNTLTVINGSKVKEGFAKK